MNYFKQKSKVDLTPSPEGKRPRIKLTRTIIASSDIRRRGTRTFISA